MIKRSAQALLRRLLTSYPVVALLGPRQAGKTTLARSLGKNYFDLELETERQRLDLAWDALVPRRELTVLDEAQAWPDLFPKLRHAVDADRKRNGRFLILGSVSPMLMTQVSESLAGRITFLELTPFLLDELPGRARLDRHWFFGGYPDGGILEPAQYPRWHQSYWEALAWRDLPLWGLASPSQTTVRLFKMLAAVHGQEWNASRLGQSLGLSYHTINSYLDYLEGAYLIRRLPAYHANLSKRLCKRPKVFFRDSGLLHALLGVPSPAALLDQPWVGASWEGYVIEQVLGALRTAGQSPVAYFFRTSDQYELDLVLDIAGERWAIEIKLTSQPRQDDFQRLEKAAAMISAKRRILISRIATPTADSRQERISCNLPWLTAWLASRPWR